MLENTTIEWSCHDQVGQPRLFAYFHVLNVAVDDQYGGYAFLFEFSKLFA